MKNAGYDEMSLLTAVTCFENTYKDSKEVYDHAIWILQNSTTPIAERIAIAICKKVAKLNKLTLQKLKPFFSYISAHKELGKYLARVLCKR